MLAQPEFAGARAENVARPAPTLLEIVWRWFVDHVLQPIFTPIAHAIGASKDAGTIVGLLLIGLAVLGLGFVVFRLAVAFFPSISPRARLLADTRPLDRTQTREDWLAIARSAGARGDYRAAIAALFSAALAALDDLALVQFDAARTPGEYRRLVRRTRAAASVPFDELTERFVRAVYAERLPERDDFEAAQRALATFEPLIRT